MPKTPSSPSQVRIYVVRITDSGGTTSLYPDPLSQDDAFDLVDSVQETGRTAEVFTFKVDAVCFDRGRTRKHVIYRLHRNPVTYGTMAEQVRAVRAANAAATKPPEIEL